MRRRLSALMSALLAAIPLIAWGLTSTAGAHPEDASSRHGITRADSDRKLTQLDTIGDGEFSSTCAFDDREPDPNLNPNPTGQFIPQTGQQAVNCDNKVAQVDITSYSLAYLPSTAAGALKNPLNPTQTVPTLEATWTLGANWPAKTDLGPVIAQGSKQPETLTGFDIQINFRNPYLEINDLWPVCDTTGSMETARAYRASRMGADHWQDHHHLFISLDYRSTTLGWDGEIEYGYFSAWSDVNFDTTIGNFETNPLYEPGMVDTNGDGVPDTNATETVAEEGNGTFYFYQVVGDTVTVRVPATWVETSSVCLKTHDPTKHNNVTVGGQDLEAATNIDLPNQPNGTPGASDNGTNNGYEYHPFALSSVGRANAPVSVVRDPATNSYPRFPYPCGKGGCGGTNNDELTDISAVLSALVVVPVDPPPIPAGAVTGETFCPLARGEIPFSGRAHDELQNLGLEEDNRPNPNDESPAGGLILRCATPLEPGGVIDEQPPGLVSFTTDRSSLSNGTPSYKGPFLSGDVNAPLLTTSAYGPGCVSAVRNVPLVDVGSGVAGNTAYGLAGTALVVVQNPFLTRGQRCGIDNPYGARWYSVPEMTIQIIG